MVDENLKLVCEAAVNFERDLPEFRQVKKLKFQTLELFKFGLNDPIIIVFEMMMPNNNS